MRRSCSSYWYIATRPRTALVPSACARAGPSPSAGIAEPPSRLDLALSAEPLARREHARTVRSEPDLERVDPGDVEALRRSPRQPLVARRDVRNQFRLVEVADPRSIGAEVDDASVPQAVAGDREERSLD